MFVPRPGRPAVRLAEAARPPGDNRLSLPDEDEARSRRATSAGAITPFGARGRGRVIVDAASRGCGSWRSAAGGAGRAAPPQAGQVTSHEVVVSGAGAHAGCQAPTPVVGIRRRRSMKPLTDVGTDYVVDGENRERARRSGDPQPRTDRRVARGRARPALAVPVCARMLRDRRSPADLSRTPSGHDGRAAGAEALPSPDGGCRPSPTRPARPAGRDPRRRLLDGPGRAVLHDAARGPRRGRRQGRATRGRRDARLGPAVGRRRGRRDADGRLLPRRQPQQASDPPRPQDARTGREVLRRLLADADVLVENFRVGASTRLGFGDDGAAGDQPGPGPPRDPRLRHDGPDAGQPGYDFVIQAVGGLMSITGATDADGGGPTKVGVAISDVVTGLFGGGLGAGRAARAGRREAGRGRPADRRVAARNRPWRCSSTRPRTRSSTAPRRGGWATPTQHRPVRDVRDGGRRARGRRRQRAAVAAAVRGARAARAGRGPAVRDQRRPGRAPGRPAPDPRARFASRRPPTGSRSSTAPTSRAGPINDVTAAFATPQAVAREMAVEVEHPVLGADRARSGCRSGCPRPRHRSAAPRRCWASTPPEILAELGYGPGDVDTLRALGAI